jgi:hypothetical protein
MRCEQGKRKGPLQLSGRRYESRFDAVPLVMVSGDELDDNFRISVRLERIALLL